MTTLKNMHEAENRIPLAYAKLLQRSCGGHALWFPRSCNDGGGNVGDIGVINRGVFGKTGNVYSDAGGLDFDAGQYVTLDRVNDAFRSSGVVAVQFGPYFRDALPPGVAPGSIMAPMLQFLMNRSDTPAACLVLAGEHTLQSAVYTERDRLQTFLAHNYERLQAINGPKVVILHRTLKASGWLGGLAPESAASRRAISVPTTFAPSPSLPSAGEHALLSSYQCSTPSPSAQGSNPPSPRPSFSMETDIENVMESSVSLPPAPSTTFVTLPGLAVFPQHLTRGPSGWNPDSPRDQTVVVGYVKARKRYRVKAAVSQVLRLFTPTRGLGRSERQQTSEDSVGDRTHIDGPALEQEQGPVKEATEGCEDDLDFILSAALDADTHVDLMVGSSDLVSAYYDLPAGLGALDKIDFVLQTETMASGETIGYICRICPKDEETLSPLLVEAHCTEPWTLSNDQEDPIITDRSAEHRDVPQRTDHFEHTKEFPCLRSCIPNFRDKTALSTKRRAVVS